MDLYVTLAKEVPGKRVMEVSKTEIVSLVSQTGDEYFALLLVPNGCSNRIVLGRGANEVEAHEQLVSELAKLIVAKFEMPL
jgi:hypothetical protein